MLQALVITLREGFEAFLIVAISLAYLRQSGRAQLISAVHWGLAVAAGVSALGGYLLYHAANQEWLDGPLAMIAAASVTWMVVHMWRFGRRMKKDIEGHLRESSVKPGAAAFAGVFLCPLLTYLLVILPLAWLLIKAIFSRGRVFLPRAAAAIQSPQSAVRNAQPGLREPQAALSPSKGANP